MLRPTATLDAIAERPEDAAQLPRATLFALHAKAVRALAALQGPLLAAVALPPATPALPDVLTIDIDEAARRINVPPSRIKAAIRSGALQSQKVGRYRRIRPEWLEEFVRAEEGR